MGGNSDFASIGSNFPLRTISMGRYIYIHPPLFI
jgi:hypothetical protein